MKSAEFIPLSQPFIGEAEFSNLKECLSSGKLSGDGRYTRQCEAVLEEEFGAHRALLTTSCTAALEIAALLLDIGPGDEVILPSFTFVSTANAFVLRGAKVVFADIDPRTFNLDPVDVEKRITTATKAIVPVHYASVSCDMQAFTALSSEYGVAIVEDAAQAVNAKWHDRYLGTIGDIGTFSFHDTKNFTGGEGGALLLRDDGFTERAEIIREKGTNRRQFFLGNVDKYTWVDIGSSYIPSELNAALLLAQLNRMGEITRLRKRAFEFYHECFGTLVASERITMPIMPSFATSNYHLYSFLCSSRDERDRLICFLNENNVGASFHYIPLHSSPYSRCRGLSDGSLPNTDMIAGRQIRLPLYAGIGQRQQERIAELVTSFFARS